MTAAALAGAASAAADDPSALGVLLAASFVVLGATLAMPSGDERYVRAGLVAACLAVLVFWSWSYPSVPADGGHRIRRCRGRRAGSVHGVKATTEEAVMGKIVVSSMVSVDGYTEGPGGT